MGLRETAWEGVGWIRLAQGCCEHSNEPLGYMKGGDFLTS